METATAAASAQDAGPSIPPVDAAPHAAAEAAPAAHTEGPTAIATDCSGADEGGDAAATGGSAPAAPEGDQGASELPSDAALVARLQALLKEVDLSVTSEKMLRRTLESEFGCDLAAKKALVRAEVMAYLDSQKDEGGSGEQDGGSGGGEEPAPSKKRARGRNGGFGDHLSPAMQAFLGVERCARTQVVKKMWEYIKAHDLQDPRNRRNVLLDDKLKTIFPGKSVNMLTMQKHLTKHVYVDDTVQEESSSEDEGEDEGEEAPNPKKAKHAAAAAAAKAKAKPRAKKAAADGAPAKPNGFMKPLRLSPEMAAWMGKPEASRPEMTKHLWAYVKERNLQNPANKQFVLADATLKALTGQTEFKAFGFAKLIKDHIIKDA